MTDGVSKRDRPGPLVRPSSPDDQTQRRRLTLRCIDMPEPHLDGHIDHSRRVILQVARRSEADPRDVAPIVQLERFPGHLEDNIVSSDEFRTVEIIYSMEEMSGKVERERSASTSQMVSSGQHSARICPITNGNALSRLHAHICALPPAHEQYECGQA